MAINFLHNVNFNKNEIQNIRIQNEASNPAGVTGMLYYNTTDSILRVYNGAAWLDLAVSTGGSAISGVTGTNGVSASNTGGVVTVQHADTSTQDDVTNTAQTYIQSIGLDTFGHLTSISSSTVTLAGLGYTGVDDADNYGGFTVTGNTGVSESITSDSSLTIIGDGNDTAVSALEMTITNTDKGSAQNIYKSLAADTGTDSAASNTDTLTFTGGDGVGTSAASVTGGSEITFDVDSTVVRTSGNQTITGVKTFSDNVNIDGNLTVSGATITTISETVNVEDSIMLLNSNAPAVPVDDSGFAVERGDSETAYMIWDESDDKFIVGLGAATDNASGAGNITIDAYADFKASYIEGDKISLGSIAAATVDTNAFVVSDSGELKTRTGAQLRSDIGAGTVSSIAVESTTDSLNVNSGSPVTSSGTISLSLDEATTAQSGIISKSTVAETRALSSTAKSVTPASLEGLRARANIGNGTDLVFDISHGLGTKDVIVQLYDNADFSTVYADVVRTEDNIVRITFTEAPTTNQYRVLVYKV